MVFAMQLWQKFFFRAAWGQSSEKSREARLAEDGARPLVLAGSLMTIGILVLPLQDGAALADSALEIAEILIGYALIYDFYHIGGNDFDLDAHFPSFFLPIPKILRSDVADVVAAHGDTIAGVFRRQWASWV